MEKDLLALMGQPNAAWGQRPNGFPSFALFRISGANGHTLQGRDYVSQARVQINCYGASYRQGREAADAVLAILDGYRGGAFLGIWHDNARDMNRDQNLADSGQLFGVQLDFLITYRQEPVT